MEDTARYTKLSLDKIVKIDAATVASGIYERLAVKLFLWANSVPIPSDSKISKLLKQAKKDGTSMQAPIVLYTVEDGHPHLTLRMPVFEENEQTTKVASQLIQFAMSLLNVRKEFVKVHLDESLGSDLSIPANLSKAIDNLIVSADSETGVYSGSQMKHSNDVSLNLVETLAACHLLSRKVGLVRKRPHDPRKPFVQLNYQVLFDSVTSIMGVKNVEESYSRRFVKIVLVLLTKASNHFFVSGWNRSLKLSLKVKSTKALLFLFGYTEVVPDFKRLLEISKFSTTKKIEGTKVLSVEMKEIKGEDSNSQADFKAFLKIMLPAINPEVSLDHQIKVDSLAHTREDLMTSFNNPKVIRAVDSMNVAYARCVGVRGPKSKVTVQAYEAARSHTVNLAKELEFRDNKGKVYKDLSEVPKPVVDWAAKKLHYRFPVLKRQAEQQAQASHAQSTPMEVDGSAAVGTVKEGSRRTSF